MADPHEPKKETVRITLPPRPSPSPSGTPGRDTVRINLPARPPANGVSPGSTSAPAERAAPLPQDSPGVPVVTPPALQTPALSPKPLPFLPPPSPSSSASAAAAAPPTSKTPTTPLPPSPIPAPPASSTAAAAMPAITPVSDHSPGPKKETARITVLPDPPPRRTPTVQMKKTQPLITMPDRQREGAPITVATTNPAPMADTIPMPLCWALLGVSTLVLLIQIWSYFG